MSTEAAPAVISTGSKLFRSLTSSRSKREKVNINGGGPDTEEISIKPQRAGTLRMRARAQMGETAQERRKVGGGGGGENGRKTPDGLVIDPKTGLGSDGMLYIKNLDDPSEPPASPFQLPPTLSPESQARAQFANPSPFPSAPQQQPPSTRPQHQSRPSQTVRLRDGSVIDIQSTIALVPQQQQGSSPNKPSTTGRSRSNSRVQQRPTANQLFGTAESAPPLPSLPLAPLQGNYSGSPPAHQRKSSWTPQPGFESGFQASSTVPTAAAPAPAPRPNRSRSNTSYNNSGAPPPSSFTSPPVPSQPPLLRARASSNAPPASFSNERSFGGGGGSDQGHGGTDAGAGGEGGGWNKVKRSMTLTRKGTRKHSTARDPNRPPSPERVAAAPKIYTAAQLALEMERSQTKPLLAGKEEERLTQAAFY